MCFGVIAGSPGLQLRRAIRNRDYRFIALTNAVIVTNEVTSVTRTDSQAAIGTFSYRVMGYTQ